MGVGGQLERRRVEEGTLRKVGGEEDIFQYHCLKPLARAATRLQRRYPLLTAAHMN